MTGGLLVTQRSEAGVNYTRGSNSCRVVIPESEHRHAKKSRVRGRRLQICRWIVVWLVAIGFGFREVFADTGPLEYFFLKPLGGWNHDGIWGYFVGYSATEIVITTSIILVILEIVFYIQLKKARDRHGSG